MTLGVECGLDHATLARPQGIAWVVCRGAATRGHGIMDHQRLATCITKFKSDLNRFTLQNPKFDGVTALDNLPYSLIRFLSKLMMISFGYHRIFGVVKCLIAEIRNGAFFAICLRICTIMSVHTPLETYFSIARLQPTIEYTPK